MCSFPAKLGTLALLCTQAHAHSITAQNTLDGSRRLLQPQAQPRVMCARPARTADFALLELPCIFIEDLASRVDDKSLILLTRTCKALLRLALQRSNRCSLRLCAAMCKASAGSLLAQATQHAPEVALELLGGSVEDPSVFKDILQTAVQARGLPLTNIHHVTFTDTTMETALPHWLTSCCPNLQSLTLNLCHLRHPTIHCTQQPTPGSPCLKPHSPTTSASAPVSVTTIQRLVVRTNWNHYGSHVRFHALKKEACQVLQSTLKALPSLTDLIVPAALVHHVTLTHGQQLTSLGYEQASRWEEVLPHVTLAATLPDFPMLHTVRICEAGVLGSTEVGALLAANSVRRVYCRSIKLQNNDEYVDHACGWEVLSVARELHVKEVALLPVQHIQRLEVRSEREGGDDKYTVLLSADPDANERVSDALLRTGGVQWASCARWAEHQPAPVAAPGAPTTSGGARPLPGVQVLVKGEPCAAACLTGFLPSITACGAGRTDARLQLANISGICLKEWQTLCQHLLTADKGTQWQVCLSVGCGLTASALLVLLSCLGPRLPLSVQHRALTEEQLLGMLCGRGSGGRVSVGWRVSDAVAGRLQEMAASHGLHLALELNP